MAATRTRFTRHLSQRFALIGAGGAWAILLVMIMSGYTRCRFRDLEDAVPNHCTYFFYDLVFWVCAGLLAYVLVTGFWPGLIVRIRNWLYAE